MSQEYPLNRDTLIRKAEQTEKRLMETVLTASIGLIRLAAESETKSQAIRSLPYFETLWKEAHGFYSKWKAQIISISDIYKTDSERLNSELDLLDAEFTNESLRINSELLKLKRKNDAI